MHANTTRTGITLGLLAVGALAVVTLFSEPAPAAGDPPARAHDHGAVAIRGTTADTLRAAEDLLHAGRFTEARQRIARARAGLAVSGEPGDYFHLRRAELGALAASGDVVGTFDELTAWLLETPTDTLATTATQFARGIGAYDEVLALHTEVAAGQPGSPAAARLAVSALEAEAALGNTAILTDVAALTGAADQAAGHPHAWQTLVSLWAMLPATEGAAVRDADALRATLAALGTDAVPVTTLLDWAAIAERDGHLDEARTALDTARPLLVTTSDQVRWDWSYANINYFDGNLDEARIYAELVLKTAETDEIDFPFDFAGQARILLHRIRHSQ